MAETVPGDSSPESDREFNPSAEMLIDEIDDEQTLEEEEAQDSGDSNEVAELEKEGDMPLEQLLAMYGYSDEGPHPPSSDGEAEFPPPDLTPDLTLDKEQIARDLLPDETPEDREASSSLEFLARLDGEGEANHRTLRPRTNGEGYSEDDDEDDEDYVPADDWKKNIQVGPDYQAKVPAGLCAYDESKPVPYDSEDRLLWDPTRLDDKQVESYLDEYASLAPGSPGMGAVPAGGHVRDDEQALFLLMQCDGDFQEALRRKRMQSVTPATEESLWSEEDCRNFESGLRMYGKDFHMIQKTRLPMKSVGDLVHFYYLWKKTERHDMFANHARLGKKKYNFHPGVTDYMDRLLDESESQASSRASSPNFSSSLKHKHLISSMGSSSSGYIPSLADFNTGTPTIPVIDPNLATSSAGGFDLDGLGIQALSSLLNNDLGGNDLLDGQPLKKFKSDPEASGGLHSSRANHIFDGGEGGGKQGHEVTFTGIGTAAMATISSGGLHTESLLMTSALRPGAASVESCSQ
ncbi:mesoderm induction early response protein 1-like isoform X2 [Branchiostoma floridae x Branchiostoma japonicum]